MAITTYAELQSAIENWLGHTLFTSAVPDFITLFEAEANRRLRARQQETSTTLTPSSGTATLPTDYLSWRRVTWQGDPIMELEYQTPSYLRAWFATTPSGIPRFFTIEGSSLLVRPVSDTGIELDYYQKIPSLSASATSNWLLAAHPDVYLFGSLVEAEMFGVHDARAGAWLTRRDSIFEAIQRLSNVTKAAGAIRVMGATP